MPRAIEIPPQSLLSLLGNTSWFARVLIVGAQHGRMIVA